MLRQIGDASGEDASTANGCFHKIRGRGIISQGTENCKGHELLERLKSREMRTNDMKIRMLGVDFSALAKSVSWKRIC
jgi:hypothetical protein